MIVTTQQPFVALSAEAAAWLEANTNMRALRVRARGANPRVAQELLDIREVALTYEAVLLPQAEGAEPEVAAQSKQSLSSIEVAEREGISDSAVRLACRQQRIEAQLVAGRWQIAESAYESYRVARAA